MGRMLMWLARRGAVGGTARWAAAFYKHVKARHPELRSDQQILQKMIEYRYQPLREKQRRDRVLYLAAQHGRAGLRMLVTIILGEEAGLYDNEPQVRDQFLQIIEEELVKSGLPDSVIHGA